MELTGDDATTSKKGLTVLWHCDSNRAKRRGPWVGFFPVAGGAEEIEERFGLSGFVEGWKERNRNKGHELLQWFVALFFTELLRRFTVNDR